MCIYIRTIPLCGHPAPTLLAYASCGAVLAQLLRIAEPAAWATPAARARVPFDLPGDCGPREGANVWTRYSDDYCGWECRNNAYLVRAALGINDDDDDDGDGDEDEDGDGGYARRGGMLPAYVPGDEGALCVLGRSRDGRGGGSGTEYLCRSGRGARQKPMVMGMPDARYGPGSERLGIGWRSG